MSRNKIGQKWFYSLGLAQLPLMVGLLIMAIAIPAVTKLVQNPQDTRNLASSDECATVDDCSRAGCVAVSCSGVPRTCRYNCTPTATRTPTPRPTIVPTRPPTATATSAPVATNTPTSCRCDGASNVCWGDFFAGSCGQPCQGIKNCITPTATVPTVVPGSSCLMVQMGQFKCNGNVSYQCSQIGAYYRWEFRSNCTSGCNSLTGACVSTPTPTPTVRQATPTRVDEGGYCYTLSSDSWCANRNVGLDCTIRDLSTLWREKKGVCTRNAGIANGGGGCYCKVLQATPTPDDGFSCGCATSSCGGCGWVKRSQNPELYYGENCTCSGYSRPTPTPTTIQGGEKCCCDGKRDDGSYYGCIREPAMYDCGYRYSTTTLYYCPAEGNPTATPTPKICSFDGYYCHYNECSAGYTRVSGYSCTGTNLVCCKPGTPTLRISLTPTRSLTPTGTPRPTATPVRPGINWRCFCKGNCAASECSWRTSSGDGYVRACDSYVSAGACEGVPTPSGRPTVTPILPLTGTPVTTPRLSITPGRGQHCCCAYPATGEVCGIVPYSCGQGNYAGVNVVEKPIGYCQASTPTGGNPPGGGTPPGGGGNPPPSGSCSYNSLQARVQISTTQPWVRSVTLNAGQKVHLGCMYNGSGQLASNVRLTAKHSDGTKVEFDNAMIRDWQPPKSGLYTIYCESKEANCSLRSDDSTVINGGDSCRDCPSDFKCYKNPTSGLWRWYVSGYVGIGYSQTYVDSNGQTKNYVDNDCLSRNVLKPKFKGKMPRSNDPAGAIGGDANCDGFVNGEDYSVWRRESVDEMKTGSYWEADYNCDNRTDGQDYSIWRRSYIDLNGGNN